ncbi:MAG: hypothetical protein ACFFAO_21410, partial [Candidatus Hermodarchaeota archaeon]
MISGIKRKKTAIESTYRYFQTIDLIINHFKREADREKIFELTSQETTLKNLLIATAAIHLYHNLGIRVKESVDLTKLTLESTKNLELKEKQILTDEVSLLLKESLSLEIDMLKRSINLENQILSFLVEERQLEIKNQEKVQKLNEIDNQIEQTLIEIILNYPPFYFYDLIGDLIGLTDEIKINILEESSLFKDLSVEIEKKIVMEEKEDKFVELSTLNRLINKIQNNFEFKSYKELQMQTMPVRMIKRKVLDYNLSRFPISLQGLKTFLEANNLKMEVIEKINDALEKKIRYNKFEEEMLSFLKLEIVKQLKTNPNDFIYFLESLNESSFDEIVFLLNKYGIYNILHIMNIDEDIAQKVKKNMIRYNIDKFDIMALNSEKKNLLFLAKKAIFKINFPKIKEILQKNNDISEFSLIDVLKRDSKEFEMVWEFLEKEAAIKVNDLREFVRKKEIIDKVFLSDLNLNSYSQILLLLGFEEIIENLAKDIFYYLFSKIIRQVSRIIESYLKTTNDKALYLVALKKIYDTTDSEDWVKVKLEELMINRLKKRQNELVIVFNADNQPFLVNGFILARLMDVSLNEGKSALENDFSKIYDGIKQIKLKKDIISPVSYCISYDLVKRFEVFEDSRKLKVEQFIQEKEKIKEEKKKRVREKQEESTLNWIERRITSSLMRINSPGINPNQLYWQEKDTKTAQDNIKLHSELSGNPIQLISEYFKFVVEKIREFSEIPLPDDDLIHTIVVDII